MAKPIKHTFQSAVADAGTAGEVGPSEWNDGHDGVEVVRKAADQSFSTTTFNDSTDLSFTLVSGATYLFEYVVFFTTNAATVGIKLSVNGPTTSALRYGVYVPAAAPAGGGSAIVHSSGTAYSTEPTAVTAGPGTAATMAVINGSLVTTAAGTLVLRHGSETATATTILAGSWGRLTRLA